jgi:purine-nucleoside phosphorylase
MKQEFETAEPDALVGPTPAEAAASILKRSKLRPTLGIVLGSGFQAVLSRCMVVLEMSYSSIPGFPRLTVPGHEGKLCLAHLAKTPLVILSGRAHYYEGHGMEAVTFATRVLAAMGIKSLLLTNAAGAIRSGFKAGDFMYVTDHINFMGVNPLRSRRDEDRFVDLSDTYDPKLNRLLKKAAGKAKARIHGGVYLAVSGPSYETPAEVRAFSRLGADAVGMSTVPEAIVARQCGIQVAALSCITNLAAGRSKGKLSHAEVLAAGEAARPQAAKIIETFAHLYAENG